MVLIAALVPGLALAAVEPVSLTPTVPVSLPVADLEGRTAQLGTCAECHEPQVAPHLGSAHGKLNCVDCHGGDPESLVPEESMSPGKKFVGKVARRDIPAFCSGCHGDAKRMEGTGLPTNQLQHYRASFHGKKVLGEGDTNAAVCTDCHGSHDVLSGKDPRSPVHRSNIPQTCERCHSDDEKMNQYAIPTDQYKKWKQSFHGKAIVGKKDLSAAVCTDCHGKHDIVEPVDKTSHVHPLNVVQTCSKCHSDSKLMRQHGLPSSAPADYLEGVHGVALMKKGITAAPNCIGCHGHHAALPPAVKNVAMVCGRCHVRSEEYYNKSPHKQAAKFRGCIECHGNHKIASPGPHLFASACERCHPQGSPAFSLGKTLSDTFQKGVANLEKAQKEIEEARGLGFALEKLEAVVEDGRQAKVETVPALHTLDIREAERFLLKTEEVEQAVRHGCQDIRTRVRLRNLSLASVLLLVLGAMLVMKLKLESTEETQD